MHLPVEFTNPKVAGNVRFGYAIPVETIWKVYPELEKELPSLLKRSPLVEGIHLLPYGYDFRIQNFIIEYLGTPEQPEPFGGRDDELKSLDDWLNGDVHRLLLTAPAGRGKSALLVRWLDQLVDNDDLALVFIPVSIRFRTNLASTFFASLAARLAYLHGEDIPLDLEFSTDIWRGLVNTYLAKPITDNKKLLIVLDGIDEAGDWEANANLIPAVLPKNVYVVVSTRFLAGDEDESRWLSRLGWERKGIATTHELSPLNSGDVADILRRMGAPLDQLSRRLDIVSELYRISEGDPLLVNSYVEELWGRGKGASQFRPEDLQKIVPGYEGLARLPKKTQANKLIESAILNLLAGAFGSLTLDELHYLFPTILSKQIIKQVIESNGKLVVFDGKGYVFAHPRIQEYYWGKLDEKEKKQIDKKFISWAEMYLLDGSIFEINLPEYLLNNYQLHRNRSNEQAKKLKAFLCHSSEDKPRVRELYKGLCEDGIDVWLDEEKILPGQDWDSEIIKALDSSNVVIVCTSKNSVIKIGYVQKEIKSALKRAELQPEGSIYIIPVKFEECNVPNSISHLQWVNLYETEGYGKLLKALTEKSRQL